MTQLFHKFKKMSENKQSYQEAFDELQTIVRQLESGNTTVDELSLKIKRASELIKICKEKLHTTEMDVQQILKDLEEL